MIIWAKFNWSFAIILLVLLCKQAQVEPLNFEQCLDQRHFHFKISFYTAHDVTRHNLIWFFTLKFDFISFRVSADCLICEIRHWVNSIHITISSISWMLFLYWLRSHFLNLYLPKEYEFISKLLNIFRLRKLQILRLIV